LEVQIENKIAIGYCSLKIQLNRILQSHFNNIYIDILLTLVIDINQLTTSKLWISTKQRVQL